MKLPSDILKKIAHSLEEEEVDVYTLTLYSLNSNDMAFFGEKDRRRVESIFKILTKDTKRHADLLRLIIEMGSK